MGGFPAPAPLINTLPEALKYGGHDKFHKGEGNVKNHSQYDNGANCNVPVRGDIAILSLEEEEEFLGWEILAVVEVEEHDDQAHVHDEDEGAFENVGEHFVGDEEVALKVGEFLENYRHYKVVHDEAHRDDNWNGKVQEVVAPPQLAVVLNLICDVEWKVVVAAEAVGILGWGCCVQRGAKSIVIHRRLIEQFTVNRKIVLRQ